MTPDLALRCPDGHPGPWRYVEAIEVWREVLSVTADELVVNGFWQTGEGYNEGIEGSEYLLCWHDDGGGGKCVKRIPVPDGVEVDWQ